MAPERFEGRSDRRSDVYALGATLYELLTLRPLFGEVNRAKLIDRILHEPPTTPRKLDRQIPRDLETIVLKALAKEPGRRYRDAVAMADDLRRFVEGRPIRARRIGAVEQAWRWGRRNPALAAMLVLVLALMAGGTIAAAAAANHFRNLAQLADSARLRANGLALRERDARREASRRAAEAHAARAEADLRAEEARAVAEFLVNDLLGTAAPGRGRGIETTVGEALARADAAIEERFAGQPLLAASIHFQMGETDWYLGRYDEAARHWRAAADLRAGHPAASAPTPARPSGPSSGWSAPCGWPAIPRPGPTARPSSIASDGPSAPTTPTRSSPCWRSRR